MSSPDEQARAQAVKNKYAADMLNKANVVGVGVGLRQQGGVRTDEVALVVMVRRKVTPDQLDPQDLIPSVLDGVVVDVQEVGEISAQ